MVVGIIPVPFLFLGEVEACKVHIFCYQALPCWNLRKVSSRAQEWWSWIRAHTLIQKSTRSSDGGGGVGVLDGEVINSLSITLRKRAFLVVLLPLLLLLVWSKAFIFISCHTHVRREKKPVSCTLTEKKKKYAFCCDRRSRRKWENACQYKMDLSEKEKGKVREWM